MPKFKVLAPTKSLNTTEKRKQYIPELLAILLAGTAPEITEPTMIKPYGMIEIFYFIEYHESRRPT